MKHLCDLPISTIRQIFSQPRWEINEKLDGSYLRAGIDEDGRFYTLRKGKAIYYNVNDWPDMAWTNHFRSAHIALRELFALLRDEGNLPVSSYLDVEILAGEMPNSIQYGLFYANSIWIHGGNFEIDDVIVGENSLFRYQAAHSQLGAIYVSTDMWKSFMGDRLEKSKTKIGWNIAKNRSTRIDPRVMRQDPIPYIPEWLDLECEVEGFASSNGQILDAKLNRKPDWVTQEYWDTNRVEFLAKLKLLRELKRKDLEILCNIYARLIKTNLPEYRSYRKPTSIEGTVVTVDVGSEKVVFKMVDKEHFAPLNNFTHIVRYWLQGGRRPERPCFLSRTASWPTDDRLKRLEILRRRYIRNCHKLVHVSRFGTLRYSSMDLNERTLVLFAELKERIANGRCGFQGQGTTNRASGDSADD